MPPPHDIDLLLRQSHWVRALALEVLGDPQGADDVTQDTLIAAVRHGVTRSDESRLRAWLHRSARNFALATRRGAARRQRRESEVARPEGLPSAADALQRIELQSRVADAIRALPSPEREIVALRYFEDLSPREIARQLGLTPNAVSTRLSRARERLRSALDGDDPRARAHWALVAAGWPRPNAVAAAALAAPLLPIGMLAMKKTALAITIAVAALLIGTVLRRDVSVRSDDTAAPGSDTVVQLADIDARREVTDDTLAIEEQGERAVIAATPTAALETAPEEVAADTGGEILVRVTRAADGEPAPGVGIRLVVFFSGAAWDVSKAAVTDARGEVTYADVPIGDATIYIERTCRDGAFDATGVTVVGGETQEVAFEVAGGTTIRGHVTDYAGRAVPGAAIWLASSGGAPYEGQTVTRADASGAYEILYTGEYQGVAARAPGLAPSVAVTPLDASEVDGDKVIDIVLPALGGMLKGRVIDGSGAPIANAKIVIGDSKPARNTKVEGVWTYDPPDLIVRSGPDGRFSTDLMGSGEIRLRARAAHTSVTESMVLVPQGGVGTVEIVLEPAARIVGRIETWAGEPLAGAQVSDRDYMLEALVWSSTTSDEDGRFELEAVRAGSIEVNVETEAGEELRATLITRAGETTEWNPVMPEVARLEGLVLAEDGTPLQGWSVQRAAEGIKKSEANAAGGTWTDAEGHFALENCLDRPHTLTVFRPGQPFTPAVLTRTGVSPADTDVTLVVPTADLPACGFTGRVTDADGSPIAAKIELNAREPTFVWTWRELEPDGLFDIHHLPAASYELQVTAEGYVAFTSTDYEPLAEGEQRNLGTIVLQRD